MRPNQPLQLTNVAPGGYLHLAVRFAPARGRPLSGATLSSMNSRKDVLMFKSKSSNSVWFYSAVSFAAGVMVALAVIGIVQRLQLSDSIKLVNVSDDDLAAKLVGQWDIIDPRTPGNGASKITFHPSGRLERDPIYDERWFCSHGVIYVLSNRIDGVQNDGKEHLVPLIPEFDDATQSLRLASAWGHPRAVLTKPVAD